MFGPDYRWLNSTNCCVSVDLVHTPISRLGSTNQSHIIALLPDK